MERRAKSAGGSAPPVAGPDAPPDDDETDDEEEDGRPADDNVSWGDDPSMEEFIQDEQMPSNVELTAAERRSPDDDDAPMSMPYLNRLIQKSASGGGAQQRVEVAEESADRAASSASSSARHIDNWQQEEAARPAVTATPPHRENAGWPAETTPTSATRPFASVQRAATAVPSGSERCAMPSDRGGAAIDAMVRRALDGVFTPAGRGPPAPHSMSITVAPVWREHEGGGAQAEVSIRVRPCGPKAADNQERAHTRRQVDAGPATPAPVPMPQCRHAVPVTTATEPRSAVVRRARAEPADSVGDDDLELPAAAPPLDTEPAPAKPNRVPRGHILELQRRRDSTVSERDTSVLDPAPLGYADCGYMHVGKCYGRKQRVPDVSAAAVATPPSPPAAGVPSAVDTVYELDALGDPYSPLWHKDGGGGQSGPAEVPASAAPRRADSTATARRP